MKTFIVILLMVSACSVDTTDEPILQNVSCDSSREDAGDDVVAKATFYCWSYGDYTEIGLACSSDNDCVNTGNPCTKSVCVDGACSEVDFGYRQVSCGENQIDTLWCNGTSCCGWVPIPPLWPPAPPP
jgi:hypothetical protein